MIRVRPPPTEALEEGVAASLQFICILQMEDAIVRCMLHRAHTHVKDMQTDQRIALLGMDLLHALKCITAKMIGSWKNMRMILLLEWPNNTEHRRHKACHICSGQRSKRKSGWIRNGYACNEKLQGCLAPRLSRACHGVTHA